MSSQFTRTITIIFRDTQGLNLIYFELELFQLVGRKGFNVLVLSNLTLLLDQNTAASFCSEQFSER